MSFRSGFFQYLIYIGMHLCALLKSLLHLKYKRHESSKDYIIDFYSRCHRSTLFSPGLSMKISPMPLLLEAHENRGDTNIFEAERGDRQERSSKFVFLGRKVSSYDID